MCLILLNVIEMIKHVPCQMGKCNHLAEPFVTKDHRRSHMQKHNKCLKIKK